MPKLRGIEVISMGWSAVNPAAAKCSAVRQVNSQAWAEGWPSRRHAERWCDGPHSEPVRRTGLAFDASDG